MDGNSIAINSSIKAILTIGWWKYRMNVTLDVESEVFAISKCEPVIGYKTLRQ